MLIDQRERNLIIDDVTAGCWVDPDHHVEVNGEFYTLDASSIRLFYTIMC